MLKTNGQSLTTSQDDFRNLANRKLCVQVQFGKLMLHDFLSRRKKNKSNSPALLHSNRILLNRPAEDHLDLNCTLFSWSQWSSGKHFQRSGTITLDKVYPHVAIDCLFTIYG